MIRPRPGAFATLTRVPLHLPPPLAAALWAHAAHEEPRECVGALGGWVQGEHFRARTLYPLANVAAAPEREYLADPGEFLRALRAMEAEDLSLVGLYHSHPRGPASPSASDTRLAAYPVPYLIADLTRRRLSAYLLPSGEPVEVVGEE